MRELKILNRWHPYADWSIVFYEDGTYTFFGSNGDKLERSPRFWRLSEDNRLEYRIIVENTWKLFFEDGTREDENGEISDMICRWVFDMQFNDSLDSKLD